MIVCLLFMKFSDGKCPVSAASMNIHCTTKNQNKVAAVRTETEEHQLQLFLRIPSEALPSLSSTVSPDPQTRDIESEVNCGGLKMSMKEPPHLLDK